MSAEEHEEFHSLAAWTLVIIVLIGFSIGTLAVFLDISWLGIVSLVVMAIGLLAGLVLAKVGLGVHGKKTLAKRGLEAHTEALH